MDKVHQRIGRAKERYPSVQRYDTIEYDILKTKHQPFVKRKSVVTAMWVNSSSKFIVEKVCNEVYFRNK